MWRNQKFCQIWRNFKILHMTDVKKSEIYPVFGCEICFVAIYAIFRVICFVAIYALLRGKKLNWKLYRWRKNDKYEVWLMWLITIWELKSSLKVFLKPCYVFNGLMVNSKTLKPFLNDANPPEPCSNILFTKLVKYFWIYLQKTWTTGRIILKLCWAMRSCWETCSQSSKMQ